MNIVSNLFNTLMKIPINLFNELTVLKFEKIDINKLLSIVSTIYMVKVIVNVMSVSISNSTFNIGNKYKIFKTDNSEKDIKNNKPDNNDQSRNSKPESQPNPTAGFMNYMGAALNSPGLMDSNESTNNNIESRITHVESRIRNIKEEEKEVNFLINKACGMIEHDFVGFFSGDLFSKKKTKLDNYNLECKKKFLNYLSEYGVNNLNEFGRLVDMSSSE